MSYIKNSDWFTLIELIVTTVLFVIFITIWMLWFTNMLTNLNYLQSNWKEQEAMLYDNYMLDEILSHPLEIIEFKKPLGGIDIYLGLTVKNIFIHMQRLISIKRKRN